jgi:aminopeptidase N
MRYSLFATLVAICLYGCNQQSLPATNVDPAEISRADQPGLTQEYADFRAAQVGNVRYRLDVELDPALDYFTGRNTILFDLLDDASPLTIDFLDGDVFAVAVNGNDIEIDYNDQFISIPAASLETGNNEVTIRFGHAWSDNGTGLYRYDDPDDGGIYLYTDFEPYDANSAFPLFDQPDIKGRFTLSVTAPRDWVVVSTTRESSVEQSGASAQTWSFPETPRIPSYIFSLHAGTYEYWSDEEFRIPLRVYARRSSTDLVAADIDMWFDFTRAGFDFFEEYYGVPYPYRKYDQLIVPDFNSGAMENAAAVTFNDRSFTQRDGWSGKEKKRLAEVIFHEMAHMWFGNLVTMKWWNGLWLNETFAEFMGYHAAAAKLEVADAWEGFFLDRKYVAYWTDQRRTTHPVETPVPDTDSVGANFDMISYAKGAAVIRQIEFRLGEEIFRKGINTYLGRHAEGNAELGDFVAALAEAAGTDLDQWAEEWLHTSGANTIEAQFTCTDGQVSDFALAQTGPADYPILRTQKVLVGLLRDVDGVVVTDSVIPATYSGALTKVPAANGKPCPDLVYPNHQDFGYVLVKLDPRTRDNLNDMIGRIEDSFQRVMFWQTLWDNVRFAQIPVTDYLDAVFAAAATEDDINNVDQVYAFVGSAINYLREMQDKGAEALASYRPRAESITWANVLRTRGDIQTMYLDRYLAFASSEEALERHVALLQEDVDIPGRELDQDRRWSLLRRLSAEGHDRVDELLAIEKQRDPSADGQRWAIRVEAAKPDIDVKRSVITDAANKESDKPYAIQRLSLRGLFPPGQEDLHETFADEILQTVLSNEQNPDPGYYMRARGFAAYLIPTSCTAASVARLAAAADAHQESRASIRDYMIERHEDDALCVARAALLH